MEGGGGFGSFICKIIIAVIAVNYIFEKSF